MAINYKEELNRLDSYVSTDGGEYWSPEPGQYKVTALGELEGSKPFDDDEEHKPRAKLQINVDGKELSWGMAVGKTGASTYGQLVRLASTENFLKNKEFTVVVTGLDRNKRFTLVI